MAKQKALLLVGLPHTGVPLLTAALEAHRDALVAAGVRVPAKSVDEVFRAAVELRREHRAWGLRRRDVEGTWAGICRRVHKHPEPAVVGHELLAGASAQEVALLVDGLGGRRVDVVVLAGPPDARVGLFPDELDLADVLARWAPAAGAADRVHVVASGPEAAWRTLGRLAGFDAEALPLPHPAVLDGPADVDALRLLAEHAGAYVDHDDLVELAEHWAKTVAEAGYDVVGDLGALAPPSAARGELRTDLLQQALVEAVTEVGRLRERVRELEAAHGKRSVRLPGVFVRGA